MSYASFVLHVTFTFDILSLHSLQPPRVVNASHVQLLPDEQEKSNGIIKMKSPAHAARAMRVSEQLLLPIVSLAFGGLLVASVVLPCDGIDVEESLAVNAPVVSRPEAPLLEEVPRRW